MVSWNFPRHAAFTGVPIFFLLVLPEAASLYRKEYVYIYIYIYTYTHTYVTACRLITYYRYYRIILLVEHFYTNRERWQCWLDVYHWGAGLAVTGRIRDSGQKVLLPSLQTGSSSNPSYAHIFFLNAFLEEACIRNIIIIKLHINYKIIQGPTVKPDGFKRSSAQSIFVKKCF